MFKSLVSVAAAALFATALPVFAVTYDVNIVLDDLYINRDKLPGGPAVTITGTVETDGTAGDLTAANLVSWSFDFSDGHRTFSMTDGSAGLQTNALSNRFNMFVDGAILKARDFIFFTRVTDTVLGTQTDSRFEFFTGLDKIVYTHSEMQLATPGVYSNGFVGHENNVGNPVQFGQQNVAALTFGIARQQAAVVPLPAAGLLLGGLLAGLGAVGAGRRRLRA